MNSQELRISNWVYIGDLFGQINEKSFSTPELFEPIPLTPEIFDKIKQLNGEDFAFEWSVNFGLYWPEWDGIYVHHIKYVHQFQNFYYLIENKELIVEL